MPSLDYVDLNRTFVPVNRDDPVSAEGLTTLARRYQAVTWPELLRQPRVVVLAEAGSGKTEEFREQAKALHEDEKDAFFAAIEQVAEIGLEAALGRARWDEFEAWRQSSRPGWLFLDSVDEAKLQRHSFKGALANVAAALGGAAGRVSIYISCRATDWDPNRDLQVVQDHLPPIPEERPADDADPDEILISVVDTQERANRPAPPAPPQIAIYSLTNLSELQQRAFLVGRKVDDIEAFERAIRLRGLEPLAERPGDLNILVHAWRSTGGQFGTLTEMVEAHTTKRLRERQDRRDAELLTDEEARQAAERLAAAMTLGKLLTIKSPADESPASDALESADVLPHLTSLQRAALLRRGIFTPATYGRVRFHHRSALEYLTASWFRRLHQAGRLSESAVLRVFRKSACGITTVPPSLRAPAAWLAPHCPGLLTFLKTHDPLALIAFGDPQALPVSERASLLRMYAEKHARGEVSHEFVDQHALWMFADPRLTDAIRDAWILNLDSDFRFELLRLIEVGAIAGCYDLLQSEALDPSASNHNRTVAARALAATDDTAGMATLAAQMLARPADFGARLAPQLTAALFPKALTVEQVLQLIDKTGTAREYQVEGFGFVLPELYAACGGPGDREAFLCGVAEICRRPPRIEHERISERQHILARRVSDLARQAILKSDEDSVGPGLLAVLQVAELADQDNYGPEELALASLVRQRPALNRALFWADIEDAFADESFDREHPQVWRLRVGFRRQLWSLTADDLPWLEAEGRQREDLAQRRAAFSAVYQLLSDRPDSARDLDALAARVAEDAVLSADLVAYRAPRKETALERQWRKRDRQQARKRAAKAAETSQAWRKLKADLQANPSLLNDATRLASWPGPQQLLSLTHWLHAKFNIELSKAPTEWRALVTPFGAEVAEAYAAGMKLMWRITPPERPMISNEGQRTKYTIILAMGGLNLEAREPQWLQKISSLEAVRIAQHICQDDQPLPEWLDDLSRAWPREAVPLLLAEITKEWGLPEGAPASFLNRAQNELTLNPQLRSGLLALVDREPIHAGQIGAARSILRRAQLTPAERAAYAALTDARLRKRRKVEDWPWRLAYLALLFELDVVTAATRMKALLAGEAKSRRRARAEQAVGELFGMRGGAVFGLEQADIPTLEMLLQLSYEAVQPDHDAGREGQFTPDSRDEAEWGRNRVLTALINRAGHAAYDALLRMAESKLVGDRALRFRQIAWEVAERQTDAWAWLSRDVLAFESQALSPILTGDDLLELAAEAIDDISGRFQNGDYSSREVLETARDEDAVQRWLAEQLEFRAKGRCAVALEKLAVHANRLDIALTSLATNVEVALELKHAEKGWTLPDLRYALSQQLAEDYLRVPQRRHGLFVVTNHRGARFWRDPGSTSSLHFDDVMAVLRDDAAKLTANSVQSITVQVRGINAGKPVAPRKRAAGTKIDGVKKAPANTEPQSKRKVPAKRAKS